MSTCARSARRWSVAATACAVTPPIPASISSNTSVSPPATAASASATRESSPPEAVSAIGANGRPAFGRMRNVASSRARRAELALAELDEELALPHPERPELVGDCFAEAPRARLALGVERSGSAARPLLGPRRRPASPTSTGSPPSAEALELTLCRSRQLEKLVVRRRGEAPPAGRRSPAAAPRSPRARPAPRRATRRSGGDRCPPREAARSGRAAPLRSHRARGPCARTGRVRVPRAPRARPPRRPSSGAIAAAAALAASASSSACLRRSRRASSSCSSPGVIPSVAATSARDSARRARDRVGVARELLVPPPRRGQLAPGELRLAPPLGLLGTAERVEHVELERRTRQPALLELPRHRDEPLGRRGDVFPRHGAAPRVRPRAPVAEDAPRDRRAPPRLRDAARRVRRAPRPRRSRGHVQLRLDVCLRPLGADRRDIGACPEEQPDRLREDRLPLRRSPP